MDSAANGSNPPKQHFFTASPQPGSTLLTSGGAPRESGGRTVADFGDAQAYGVDSFEIMGVIAVGRRRSSRCGDARRRPGVRQADVRVLFMRMGCACSVYRLCPSCACPAACCGIDRGGGPSTGPT